MNGSRQVEWIVQPPKGSKAIFKGTWNPLAYRNMKKYVNALLDELSELLSADELALPLHFKIEVTLNICEEEGE